MKNASWIVLIAWASSVGAAGAQANEMDTYLNGLSAPERAAFPGALQKSVGSASQEILGLERDIQDPAIRNRAYSVELLRTRVQRSIEEGEESLAQEERAKNLSALRIKVLKETRDFLEDLSPEVNRLARESQSVEEFSGRLSSLSHGVEHWASGVRVQAVAVAPRAGEGLPPTEPNIEGPFYRPEAPFTDRLAPPGRQGVTVVISGKVLDTHGNPLQGAVVDVWQADSQGAYDIADPKDRTNPNIPYRFRGRIRTGADGAYKFSTLEPGNYEIGENQWRCKHIHYKVSHPAHRKLTTQLYFEGDPFNRTDPWWKASTTIPLVVQEGWKGGRFDVVLAAP